MKKVFKSLALSLIVAVFAICGLAGCGKKEEQPTEATVVEEITAEEMIDILRAQEYLAFVDGFTLSLNLKNVEDIAELSAAGTVILYNHGTDLQATVYMVASTGITISGDVCVKDNNTYANIDFAPKFWIEEGYDFDEYALQLGDTTSEFLEVARNLPASNPYGFFDQIAWFAYAGDEWTCEKTTSATGEVSYVIYFTEDRVNRVKFSFNKFNELSTFELFEIVDDGYVDIRMEEVGHDVRISYPADYQNYTDASARE